MIRTQCVSNRGYRDQLIVGEVYYFDKEFTAKSLTGKYYGNCYKFVEGQGFQYIGIFPRELFAIA